MLRRLTVIGRREWDRVRSRRRLAVNPHHDLQAESAITLDDLGEEVWSHRPDAPSQGASTIKVISAWLASELLDPQMPVRIIVGDSSLPPSKLRPGDVATVDALLHLSLISSDGHAAGALARTIGEQALCEEGDAIGSAEAARARYREIAERAVESRGWRGHLLVDPVGADHENRFTAREIALLFHQLRGESSRIHVISAKRVSVVRVTRGRPRPVLLVSTYRPFTVAVPELLAGKTGWLFGPAYLVWSWKDPEGRVFTSALMDSDNENRVADARAIVDASVAGGN